MGPSSVAKLVVDLFSGATTASRFARIGLSNPSSEDCCALTSDIVGLIKGIN